MLNQKQIFILLCELIACNNSNFELLKFITKNKMNK